VGQFLAVDVLGPGGILVGFLERVVVPGQIFGVEDETTGS
jgi:hypothetical protein